MVTAFPHTYPSAQLVLPVEKPKKILLVDAKADVARAFESNGWDVKFDQPVDEHVFADIVARRGNKILICIGADLSNTYRTFNGDWRYDNKYLHSAIRRTMKDVRKNLENAAKLMRRYERKKNILTYEIYLNGNTLDILQERPSRGGLIICPCDGEMLHSIYNNKYFGSIKLETAYGMQSNAKNVL